MKAKVNQKQKGRQIVRAGRGSLLGRNGEPIWEIAERKADLLIGHEGLARAEQIVALMYQRIEAKRVTLLEKYGG